MADKPTQTTMTINLPIAEVREFFTSSFQENAEASFASAPGSRGTEVTLIARDNTSYGDLREMLRRCKWRLETGEIPTNAPNANRVKVAAK